MILRNVKKMWHSNSNELLNMVRKLFFTMAIGFVVSCSDKGTSDTTYDASVLDEIQPQDKDVVEIVTDYQFGNPKQIKVVNDTLLAVFDVNKSVVHLISFQGRYLGGYGQIGKGYGEVISPECLSVSGDSSKIYLYDYRMARSITLRVSDMLKGTYNPDVLEYKEYIPMEVNRYTCVEQFDDDSYVGFGYNNKCRIQYVSDGQIISNYTEYPKTDENEEYTWSIWNNSANYAVSPDRKHVVITTGIGMLFELFTIDNGKVSSKLLKGFHKPIYGIAPGAKPACVTYVDETLNGFNTICATNDGFYGCIGGEAPNYDLGNVIYYFDYEGNLRNKYKIGTNIECLTAHKGTVYAITTDKDGEYHLLSIEM